MTRSVARALSTQSLTHISENVALEAALDQMRVNSSDTKLACSHGAENFSEVTWVQLVLFEDGREQIIISIVLNFLKVLDRHICTFSGNMDDSIFMVFSGKNGDSISTKIQTLDLQVTNLAISHARVC
jgi:hypothetical protein